MNRLLLHPAAKPALWLLLCLPFAYYAYGAVANTLGANPAEALIRGFGDWTLRCLCLTLAVTPLRQWTNWSGLARFRRTLGVTTFVYGTLHWLSYAWLDQGFVLADLLKDIAKRPFILVGTLAWLAMLPLAATSFNAAIKKLGAKRWQTLHKSVYAIVLLGLLHFFWMRAGKNDFGEWSVYAVIVAVLLVWRLLRYWRSRTASTRLRTA
ncbi:MAG TPA: protein-methionine-sulfoxide reductase heme-binding subunit MsrQ [Ideonella sp.]|nr:protein-methionine-sulfoxide reductase heme-binding subunit MsrQ [Ideonella sp.]